MTDALLTYDESSYTEELERNTQRVEIPNSKGDKPIYIEITTTEPQLRRFVGLYQKKEFLYINALKNLIIQKNFLDLALQLEEGNITEEEYDNEIDTYPEKYVADADLLVQSDDIAIIKDIIKNMGMHLTIEEISEIFSLDTEQLETKILEKE